VRQLGELGDLGELVGREAQGVEVDLDGAAVEDTQTAGLAPAGWQDRDAQIVIIGAAPHFDTSVMRLAVFGDIHVRHDLDGGTDRVAQLVDALWQRDLLQDAVDAVAQAQRALERLDVDVGTVHADRFGDDQIDEADHAGLLGLDRDVVIFLILRHRLGFGDEQVDGLRAESVEVGQGHRDVALGAEHEIDAGVEHHAQAVDRGQVRHAARGELEDAVLESQRHDAVAQGNLGGDLVDGLLLDLKIADVVERDAAGFGEGLEQIGFIDDGLLDQQPVDALERQGGAPLDLAELVKGEQAAFDEFLGDLDQQFIGVVTDIGHE